MNPLLEALSASDDTLSRIVSSLLRDSSFVVALRDEAGTAVEVNHGALGGSVTKFKDERAPGERVRFLDAQGREVGLYQHPAHRAR